MVWAFEVQSPMINKESASLSVLGDLYLKCLQESLNPFYYPASLADLEYEMKQEERGLVLTIKGYHDKAEVLFDEIMAKLKKCSPTENEFELYKNQLLRDYQNFNQESALDQGIETLQCLLHQTYASNAQKAQAIQPVTYRQFLAYSHLMFDQAYIRGLVYGQGDEIQAKRLWSKLQSTLSSQPLPENERLVERILVLSDEGPYSVKIKVPSPAHAVVLAIEDKFFSFKTRAAQQILAQAMASPFYATLRTKQQTGYIVYNLAEEINKHLFTIFAVQSNTHDARDLLARFELFIETFLHDMAASHLTEEKFETIREALKIRMMQPPTNLSEMGELLKLLTFSYDGDFDWIAKRVQGFQDLTYPEFLEIATQFLGKENKKRVAILVKGNVSSTKNLHYVPLKSPQELKKISRYTHIK
jgi:insulysin